MKSLEIRISRKNQRLHPSYHLCNFRVENSNLDSKMKVSKFVDNFIWISHEKMNR